MKGKLLREFFLENTILKIMALAFAIALWFLVVGDKRVEADFWIPLEFENLPQDMVIVGEPVRAIDVRILGSKKILENLSPNQLTASIDLFNAKAGVNNIRITHSDINIPKGIEVEVINVNPSSILIYLEVVGQGTETGP